MTKLRLLVELDVKPEQADAFDSMFRTEFITRSRAEDGCEYYELWRDAQHPNKMTIVEVWSSQKLLDVHLAQPWFGEWAPKMEEMQASAIVVRQLY